MCRVFVFEYDSFTLFIEFVNWVRDQDLEHSRPEYDHMRHMRNLTDVISRTHKYAVVRLILCVWLYLCVWLITLIRFLIWRMWSYSHTLTQPHTQIRSRTSHTGSDFWHDAFVSGSWVILHMSPAKTRPFLRRSFGWSPLEPKPPKVIVILPTLMAPPWINFCPGPAGCLKHVGTDLRKINL